MIFYTIWPLVLSIWSPGWERDVYQRKVLGPKYGLRNFSVRIVPKHRDRCNFARRIQFQRWFCVVFHRNLKNGKHDFLHNFGPLSCRFGPRVGSGMSASERCWARNMVYETSPSEMCQNTGIGVILHVEFSFKGGFV